MSLLTGVWNGIQEAWNLFSKFPALIGYAIGTAQIIVIDWWRDIRIHRRQLRCLRAELTRISEINAKFNWTPEGPTVEKLPRPPAPSTEFADTVTSIDF